MKFEESTLKHSSWKSGKIHFLSDPHEPLKLADYSIVFILAVWSGTAIRSWKLLTDLLNDLNNQHIEIYVVDIDSIEMDFVEKNLTLKPNGDGETFWVKKGRIVSHLQSINFENRHIAQEYTDNLLKM